MDAGPPLKAGPARASTAWRPALLGFIVGVDLVLAGVALIAVRRTGLRAPAVV